VFSRAKEEAAAAYNRAARILENHPGARTYPLNELPPTVSTGTSGEKHQ
jgi:hypothetical protein